MKPQNRDTFVCRLARAATVVGYRPDLAPDFATWLRAIAETTNKPLWDKTNVLFPPGGRPGQELNYPENLWETVAAVGRGLAAPHPALLEALAALLHANAQELIPAGFIPPASLLARAMTAGGHTAQTLGREIANLLTQAGVSAHEWDKDLEASAGEAISEAIRLPPLTAELVQQWILDVLGNRLLAFPASMGWIFPLASNYSLAWLEDPHSLLGLLPPPSPDLVGVLSRFLPNSVAMRIAEGAEDRNYNTHLKACLKGRD